jgi:hypothetical protein
MVGPMHEEPTHMSHIRSVHVPGLLLAVIAAAALVAGCENRARQVGDHPGALADSHEGKSTAKVVEPGAAGTAPAFDPSAQADPAAPGAAALTPGQTPCAAIGDKFVELATMELAQAEIPADQREMAAGMIPQMREQFVAKCDAEAWPEEVRTCILEAKDPEAAGACQQMLMDLAQAAESERVSAVLGAAPAEQRTACAAVADKLIGFAREEMAQPEFPADQRQMAEAMLPQIREQILGECITGNWTAEARNCLLGAESAEALRGCEHLLVAQ